MAKTLKDGNFYKFDRLKKGREIGSKINRKLALLFLRNKKNVYTPQKSDAKALAKHVQKGQPEWEAAHERGYYPHFHPAKDHDSYGHVFHGMAS